MRVQEWTGHRSDDVPGRDVHRNIHSQRSRRPPPPRPRAALTSQEPAATDRWPAGLTFGIDELFPNVEVIEMDAHALSSHYEFTAGDGRSVPQRPNVSFHGDFGAGLRASDPDAGARGDFATGTRSTSPLMPPGDFATGLRADPAAERARGDFGTGQRVNRSDPAGHYGQPIPRAVPVLA
jgi:hypothetical protein